MPEEKKKKGFLSILKESMDKTGGCCPPGCDCSPQEPQEKKSSQKGREKETLKK